MRRFCEIIALTLSSTLTIFLLMIGSGLLHDLFAEHGGDRAALLFITVFPSSLCFFYLFWKRLASRATRGAKLLVLTPLAFLTISLLSQSLFVTGLFCTWIALTGWHFVKTWHSHGKWRALFVHPMHVSHD